MNDLIEKYEILTVKELKTIKDQLIAHNIPLFRLDKERKVIVFPTEQLGLIIDNEKYSNLKIYIPKNFSIFTFTTSKNIITCFLRNLVKNSLRLVLNS